jgi:hypothetical protein
MDEGFSKSTIELKKLDNVWNSDYAKLGLIDILKIDVEEHEDFCLKYGIKTIELNRPTILMEVNKPYYESRGVDLDESFLPLIPHDYKIFRKVRRQWMLLTSLKECDKMDSVFMAP